LKESYKDLQILSLNGLLTTKEQIVGLAFTTILEYMREDVSPEAVYISKKELGKSLF
jgi:hypothetical protein